jgi:serine phosphatase RsbU (regulator of sigma subunit)
MRLLVMFFRKIRKDSKDNKDKLLVFDHHSNTVIVIGCILLAVALLIAYITSTMIVNETTFYESKRYKFPIQAKNTGKIVEKNIDEAVNVSLMMAHDPFIIHWLTTGERDNFADPYISQRMEHLVTYMNYNDVYILSAQTMRLWDYHDGKFNLRHIAVSERPSKSFTFPQQGRDYEINIENNKSKAAVIQIKAAIRENTTVLGITGVKINAAQIMQKLIDIDANKTYDVWLINDKGDICFSTNEEYMNHSLQQYLPENIITDIEQDAVKKDFEISNYSNDTESQTYDIAYKTLKDTNWKLVVRVPRSTSIEPLMNIKRIITISYVFIFICTSLLFYLITHQIVNPRKRALQLNRKLENVIIDRTQKLQERNIKLQDGMEYAQLIQQAVLPSSSEMARYLKDFFVIFEPKESVGGDFYWLRSYDDGVLLAVGDCTGHGVSGALMATAVNAMFNHITENICHNDPAIILNELAKAFRQSFISGNGKFVSTGFEIAILFLTKKQYILFAGADMPLYYYNGTQVSEIKGDKMAVDCKPIKTKKIFSNQVIMCHSGDEFYIITDGYHEQPGGKQHLPYGKQRLLVLLDELVKIPMDMQKKQIMSTFYEYMGNERRRDDITIFSFKI